MEGRINDLHHSPILKQASIYLHPFIQSICIDHLELPFTENTMVNGSQMLPDIKEINKNK